jgi:predicted phage terminase large subunit-like protein
MSELTELLDLELIQGEKARRSFKEFVRLFWPVVEPATPFVDGWHVDAVCQHLEALKDGTVRNVLINIPPRHGKSLLVAVFFPAWLWLHNPSHRFLCSSYSLQLSIRDSVKCRRLIESPLYQKCYGHIFQLTSDENRKQRFENSERGYRLSTSVESGNLGEGADTLIVDDPNNASEVNSEAERRKVWDWWSGIMSTRMNDPAKGSRLLIQQRLHEEDLSGFVLNADKGGNWCRLILPLEYQGNRTSNALGWKDPRTIPGELLSRRIPLEEISYLKGSLGTSGFSAQYNQTPAPASGEFFRADWFRYFEEDQAGNYRLGEKLVAASSCWRFATVDLAISTKTTADYTVAGIFDVTADGELILVHMHRGRIEGTKIVPTLKALDQQYRPSYWGIEKVGFQDLILQTARQEGLCVRALKAESDKITRSIPLQVKFEAGAVWFPKGKPWLMDVELELLKFAGEGSTHDDIVDVLSYAALECQKRHKNRPKEEEAPVKTWDQVYREGLHQGLL